jgi:Glycosyl transferase family 2
MKVALVCIAKREENYIQEWIDYYKKLGFDNIYIYQNDWRWSGECENVIKIEFDGKVKQRNAYNDFIQKNHEKYDWVAFFDVDEFLVLKKHNNIKDFLNDYNDLPAIGINWVLFGNNGHTKVDNEYSLLKRFTKREKNVNYHVKCIVKIQSNTRMDIHNPSGIWYDLNRQVKSGPFNNNGKDDIAQLNHYWCKTFEEFKEKVIKGRADCTLNRNLTDYHTHNKNEVDDFSAYNFMYK